MPKSDFLTAEALEKSDFLSVADLEKGVAAIACALVVAKDSVDHDVDMDPNKELKAQMHLVNLMAAARMLAKKIGKLK
jgi:hypothetical protein